MHIPPGSEVFGQCVTLDNGQCVPAGLVGSGAGGANVPCPNNNCSGYGTKWDVDENGNYLALRDCNGEPCWEKTGQTMAMMAANNNPCSGQTTQLSSNVTIQSNAQGTFTATVQLTGPEGGYTANLSSGSVSVPANTSLTIGYNGALTVSANNPIYYSTGFSGFYGGAYLSSFTYDISSASSNNAGFTQVNGTRSIFGIPLSSSQTPSAYLLNQLNQNSSLSNTAALLQDATHLGQTLTNLSRLVAGCR